MEEWGTKIKGDATPSSLGLVDGSCIFVCENGGRWTPSPRGPLSTTTVQENLVITSKATVPLQDPPKACNWYGELEKCERVLSTCSKCKSVLCCSRECQKAAWGITNWRAQN
jgi:hypothetical protein